MVHFMNSWFQRKLLGAHIFFTWKKRSNLTPTNVCMFTLDFNKILKVIDFLFSIVDKLFEAARNFTKEVDAFYTMQMKVDKSK